MSESGRLDKLRRWAGPAVSLILLVAGIYVVSRLLAEHSPAELARAVARRPPASLALAAVFSAGSWLAVTLFDTLAFRLVHVPTHWRHVARDAFTSYAISFNVGASALSGSALRLRLYKQHGFGTSEVSRIMAFNITTMWIGYAVLAGIVLLAVPVPLPEDLHLARHGVRVLAVTSLVVAGLYALLCWKRRNPLRIRSWEYPLPSLRWLLPQVAVSAAHWSFAAAAIHALMPAGSVSYPEVLALYLIEAVIGLVAHVPGGLGVLETVFVLTLRDLAPGADVLASILAFRVIYFWGALAVALLLLADHELLRKRRRERRAAAAAP